MDFAGPPFPTDAQKIDVSTGDIVSSLGTLVSNTHLQFTPCVPGSVPSNQLCLGVTGVPAAFVTNA